MKKPAAASGNAQRAWVRLPSGRRMDLRDPTFADVDDTDLSLGLARTFRWGGHSVWPLPMSVAQHSLLVLQIRRSQANCTLMPSCANCTRSWHPAKNSRPVTARSRVLGRYRTPQPLGPTTARISSLVVRVMVWMS